MKSPKRTTTRLKKSRSSPKKSRSPKRSTTTTTRLKKSRSPIDVSGLKRHSLSKYGYSSKKPVRARHTALGKAVKAYGAHVVWNKLNLVGVLNKNRSPKTSDVFISDKNWIKLKFM